jgi:hypothetical protein
MILVFEIFGEYPKDVTNIILILHCECRFKYVNFQYKECQLNHGYVSKRTCNHIV